MNNKIWIICRKQKFKNNSKIEYLYSPSRYKSKIIKEFTDKIINAELYSKFESRKILYDYFIRAFIKGKFSTNKVDDYYYFIDKADIETYNNFIVKNIIE